MKIVPTATKFARWGAYVGLFCGVLYSVGGLVVDLLTIGLNLGTLMAFGALVGMPIVFGALGFFLGVLVALISQGVGAVLGRLQR
jgi:hypothetical protein